MKLLTLSILCSLYMNLLFGQRDVNYSINIDSNYKFSSNNIENGFVDTYNVVDKESSTKYLFYVIGNKIPSELTIKDFTHNNENLSSLLDQMNCEMISYQDVSFKKLSGRQYYVNFIKDDTKIVGSILLATQENILFQFVVMAENEDVLQTIQKELISIYNSIKL